MSTVSPPCAVGLVAVGGLGLPRGVRRGAAWAPAPTRAGAPSPCFAGLPRATHAMVATVAKMRTRGLGHARVRRGVLGSTGTGAGRFPSCRFLPRSAGAAATPATRDNDDDRDDDRDGDGDGNNNKNRPEEWSDPSTLSSPPPSPFLSSSHPPAVTGGEDAGAKGLPGAATERSGEAAGGLLLLFAVTLTLATWCHWHSTAGLPLSFARLGGMWGTNPAGAAAAAANATIVGTPLQWFAVSFMVAATASAALLAVLRARGAVAFQPVRPDGPKSHTTGAKPATPTGGGAAFVPAGALAALGFTGFSHPAVVALVLATMGFMLVGAYDDMQKLRGRSNAAGLTPVAKLGLQSLVAAALCVWLAHGPLPPPPTSVTLAAFTLRLPPAPITLAGLGVAAAVVTVPLGRWFWALSAFAMVAESNAVNVTDGLDGLAASTAAVALVSMGVSLLLAGRGELAVFAICMGGAAAGFLAVNRHPADCFMGDTGSLALGGALGAVAAAAGGVATMPLVLTSGVFIAETLSVMAQVGYFKWTKRRSATGQGTRLLRMAPLHHHLELSGWGEVRVVAALTAAAGACALMGVAAAAAGRAAAAAAGI